MKAFAWQGCKVDRFWAHLLILTIRRQATLSYNPAIAFPRYWVQDKPVNTPKRKSRRLWNWLLIVPAVGLAFPAVYSRATPGLFGFPFFYWYQIAWILLSAVFTAIVYFATEGK